MIDTEMRKQITALHESGEGVCSIARKLKINRKTVKRVIQPPEADSGCLANKVSAISDEIIRALYVDCDGRVQRMHEILTEDMDKQIPYSTLTARCRELGLSKRYQEKNKRFHHVETEPGEEMQHDTSPYSTEFGGKEVKVVASIVFLRYSKCFYLKFYLQFRRYEMLSFLHEALTHFGYSAKQCVIDNTSLARLRGTGYNAQIQQQVERFARSYGFKFICHEIKHSNRKAHNERAFWTTETNFLPGRKFANLDDMNAQAYQWATVRMRNRPHSKTRLIPAETFEHEKKWLYPIPKGLPGPIQTHHRTIDPYGFTEFEANRFWVPGEDRQSVSILESFDKIEIIRGRHSLICYDKPTQDISGTSFTPDGVDTRPVKRQRRGAARKEEEILVRIAGAVPAYIEFIKKEAKGVRKANMIRQLHYLSKQMTDQLFKKTIKRALEYRITDMDVIENIARMILGIESFCISKTEVDDDLEMRESYQKGCIDIYPDLSLYDKINNPSENDEHEEPRDL